MDDIIKMFSSVEKEPKSIISERRIDYLFRYWVGRYESEEWERGILFRIS